jgi:ABC-type lipoprotein release transport system permease subunit
MLAYKNLWRNHSRTYLLMLSIGLVTCLVALLQANQIGVQQEIYQNIIKTTVGEVQIISAQEESIYFDFTPTLKKALPAALPTLQTQVWLKQDALIPLQLWGIDTFQQQPIEGLMLSPTLLHLLKLRVGDSLALYASPQGKPQFFKIGQARHISLPQSENILFLPLASAQKFLNLPNQISHLIVPHTLTKKQVGKHLKVQTWQEVLPDMVQMLLLLQVSMGFIAGILYVLLGFGIGLVVVHSWQERRLEISRLRIIGMTQRQVWRMLGKELGLLLLSGYVWGMLLALPILAYFAQNPIVLPAEVGKGLEHIGFPTRLCFVWDIQVWLVPLAGVSILGVLLWIRAFFIRFLVR